MTSLSYFIDPESHIKTLKSPINSAKRTKKAVKRTEKATVIERSPVHFDDANKFDKANNSKVLQNLHLLGAAAYRKQSIRVISEDGTPSPKTLKFMLLKQNKDMPLREEKKAKFIFFKNRF